MKPLQIRDAKSIRNRFYVYIRNLNIENMSEIFKWIDENKRLDGYIIYKDTIIDN